MRERREETEIMRDRGKEGVRARSCAQGRSSLRSGGLEQKGKSA